MITCVECHGDSPDGTYCVYCGTALPVVGETDRLGETIGSLPVRSLYYRVDQGLWYKLTHTTHVPVELTPLGIIGSGEQEDYDRSELVQPYSGARR